MVAFVRIARRRFRAASGHSSDYLIRAGALTGIVAIALQEAVDFSLQMPGNAVLFVVLLALAIRRPSLTAHTVPAITHPIAGS